MKQQNETSTTDTLERTVTVTDWQGRDKEMTEDSFIDSWLDHAKQFSSLKYDSEANIKAYDEILAIVEGMATDSFDELYKIQNTEA